MVAIFLKKGLILFNKISLVVPTRNRPQFIRRLLSYYSRIQGLQIIIGDGSDPEFIEENQKIIAEFERMDFEIIHYTPDLPSQVPEGLAAPYGYAERIVTGVKLSDRPYIQTLADDDFCSPIFLLNSAKFLEKNSDFAISAGINCAFYIRNNTCYGPIEKWEIPKHDPGGRVEETAAARIGAFDFAPRLSLDWSFHRRENWDYMGKAMMESVEAVLDNDDTTDSKITANSLFNMYGLICDHIGLAMGKMHWEPHVQMVRHFHDVNLGGILKNVHQVDWIDSIIANNWPVVIQPFIENMSNTLIAMGNTDKQSATEIAEGALALRVGARLLYLGQDKLRQKGADASDMRHIENSFVRRARKIEPLKKIVRQLCQISAHFGKEVSYKKYPELVELEKFLLNSN